MVLKIHGYDDTTIKKFGSWTSLTFLQYIHNQIAHLFKYVSRNMSIELPFLNIASIEVIHDWNLHVLLYGSGLFMCTKKSAD